MFGIKNVIVSVLCVLLMTSLVQGIRDNFEPTDSRCFYAAGYRLQRSVTSNNYARGGSGGSFYIFNRNTGLCTQADFEKRNERFAFTSLNECDTACRNIAH